MSDSGMVRGTIDIGDAARQLEQAVHDTRVAFDCIALGDLDRAHTHAITARTAVDAAVTILAAALDDTTGTAPQPAE